MHQSNYYRIWKDFELIHDYMFSILLNLSNALQHHYHAPTTYKIQNLINQLNTQKNTLQAISKNDLSHQITIDKLAEVIKSSMYYEKLG